MIFNKIAKCTLLKITFVCININLVQADYCKVPCNHGFCKIPPGYCKCDPGFGGPSCDLGELFKLLHSFAAPFKSYFFFKNGLQATSKGTKEQTIGNIFTFITQSHFQLNRELRNLNRLVCVRMAVFVMRLASVRRDGLETCAQKDANPVALVKIALKLVNASTALVVIMSLVCRQ